MAIEKAGLQRLADTAFTKFPTQADDIAGFLSEVGQGGDIGKAFEAAKRHGVSSELMSLLAIESGRGSGVSSTTAAGVLSAIDAALSRPAGGGGFDIAKYSDKSSRNLDQDVGQILKDISAHTGKTVAIARKPDRIARGGPPSLDFTQSPRDLTAAGTYFIEADRKQVGELTLHMGQQSHVTPATPRDMAAAILKLVQ